MAWSEIKKAVNSDLSAPLNEQILNALNSGKIIKHIQRGDWLGSTTAPLVSNSSVVSSTDITLSGFSNADKMVCMINFANNVVDSISYSSGFVYGDRNRIPYVSYIGTDKITIANSSCAYKHGGYNPTYDRASGTYTVIEFY